jgi:hypothetical protein
VPALLAGLLGCSNNGLTLGKVRGTVTYKGQPLTAGEILFVPDESKGTTGPQALGSIGSDGSFTMSTEESGDGAIVGIHKVAITGRDPKPVSQGTVITDTSSPEDVLKAKASMGAVTKKTAEGPTVRDRSGAVYRLLTPEKLRDPQASGITVKVERGSNVKTITIKEDGTAMIE